MISGKSLVIAEGGVRLDAALLDAFPSSTRAFVRDAIQRGDVLCNGRASAKGMKLRGGETIEVKELAEAYDNRVMAVEPKAPTPWLDTPVFEDASLLAYDKPAGMPVQPLSHRETGTMMNAVVARHGECLALGDSPLMAGAIHRIDADTSGLVLVARTARAFADLRAQFAAQTVKKTYLALVEGEVAIGGILENDLIHDPTLPYCRMIDSRRNRLTREAVAKCRPLHAVTVFRPIGRKTVECEARTLLEVTIHTGVTHQIRAQLALSGMHIVNDRLYGAFAIEGQVGHCLHAFAAKFIHPESHQPMEIKTHLPIWA